MIGRTLGRYEIVRQLGAGGMGIVYQARDTELERDVAIKVLPPEIADKHASRLARFEREAKAIASLTHPNICTLYDFCREDGIRFLVMELIDGESLATRLLATRPPNRALPLEQVLRIGTEIADALDLAHRKGIIHRDVKPGNVMLTRTGAKLLDFGVAHTLHPSLEESAEDSTAAMPLTGDGEILGTFRYMAPEQLEGKEVDARTDIFALGVVLYEMATGKSAFEGTSRASLVAAILSGEPRPVRELQPDTPPALEHVIKKCLEKDPDDRWQTASDVASELRWIGSGARRQPFRGTTLALVATLIVVLAVAIALVSRRTSPTTSPMPEATAEGPTSTTDEAELTRVAVAVFENQTGDPSLDPVGQMVADWTSEGLSRMDTIEVVGEAAAMELAHREATDGTGRDADPVRELAEISGAQLVVAGNYYLSGDILQVHTRITDAAAGNAAFAIEPAGGERAEPMEVVQIVRQRVVDAIAARYLSEGTDISVEEGRPPRYEAYKEYLAGLHRVGPGYDNATALAHYRRAIELDPEFVKPRFMIIRINLDQAKWAEMEKDLALIAEQSDRLTPIQTQRLRFFQSILDGRTEDVVQALREVVRLSPSDALNNFELASFANRANRPAEALRVLAKPLDWTHFPDRVPRGLFYYTVLAGSHHMLGQHEDELAAIRRGRESYWNKVHFLSTEARALAALGLTEEVDSIIATAATVRWEPYVAARTVSELRAHGDRAKSIALSNRMVDVLSRLEGEDAKDHQPLLAWFLYHAERWDEARAVCEEVAAELRDDPSKLHHYSRFRGYLGELAARRGDRTEARRIMDELSGLESPYLLGDNTFHCARIASQLGEKEETVNLLKKAIAEGLDNYPPGFAGFSSYWFALHEAIPFEPMRGYPPFEELMKPKG